MGTPVFDVLARKKEIKSDRYLLLGSQKINSKINHLRSRIQLTALDKSGQPKNYSRELDPKERHQSVVITTSLDSATGRNPPDHHKYLVIVLTEANSNINSTPKKPKS